MKYLTLSYWCWYLGVKIPLSLNVCKCSNNYSLDRFNTWWVESRAVWNRLFVKRLTSSNEIWWNRPKQVSGANQNIFRSYGFYGISTFMTHILHFFRIFQSNKSPDSKKTVRPKNVLIGPRNLFWPISSNFICWSQHFHKKSVSNRPNVRYVFVSMYFTGNNRKFYTKMILIRIYVTVCSMVYQTVLKLTWQNNRIPQIFSF